MLPIIMCREFIARSTKMRRSIGQLSVSALSHHGLSSVVFIINIAESDFRHTQEGRPTLRPYPRRGVSRRLGLGVTAALAFVKEDFRIFTPPSGAALPIFTDNDSQPHARATVAVLAALTQFQHAITQFVACYPTPWWRRSNLDRGRSRRRAILRRNHDPRSVVTLLVAT